MNQEIFKTYDIRGKYPDEIDEEAVKKIAVATFLYLKPKTVVLGYDARKSSPKFAKIIKQELMRLGADIYDLGMVPTEMVYFACGHLKSDLGIMITASHNPKDYNGIKMIGRGVLPITGESGLNEIKNIALGVGGKSDIKSIEKGSLGFADSAPPYAQRFGGAQRDDKKETDLAMTELSNGDKKTDLWDEYLEKVLSFIDIKKIKPLNIACDGLNGVAGLVIDKLSKKLPIKITKLNFEPNIEKRELPPNPLLSKNRDEIIKLCKEKHNLSFATVFDGDADRVAFLTEKGEFIDTDYISALIVKILLNKNPGEPIVYDLRRGWVVKDQTEGLGSEFFPSRSGYPFIKEKMRQERAIFGGEASAHYFYRDFFCSDSSIITLLLILEYLSKNNLKLSEAVEEYQKSYFMSEEINFVVSEKIKLFNLIKDKYVNGKISEVDGLSIEFSDWHFNLRLSATQPLARLNIESKNKKILESKKTEIIKLIKDNGGVISEE